MSSSTSPESTNPVGPKPKSHHFVHRAYLEGFVDPQTTKGNEGYLWVYIPGKSPFKQRPERVAKRNYYYCIEKNAERDFLVEAGLASLEDAAMPILRALEHKSFDLTADDQLTFAGYIALAFTRVPTFERSMNRLAALSDGRLMEMASNDPRLLEQAARNESEETGRTVTAEEFRKKLIGGSIELRQTSRNWSVGMMVESMLRLQVLIANMHWSFLVAPEGDPGFVTTDNPVALYDPDAPTWAGISFASPTAHFAFPVNRELCLIGRHRPMPKIQRPSASHVRQINKAAITRCDAQVYAPFKSQKLQMILDEVAREKGGRTGKVFFRKGRLVQE